MLFNCLVNLICILFVAVDCWVNCDPFNDDYCNCSDSELNFNYSIDYDDYNLTDRTSDGKYGYELTTFSEEGSNFLSDVDERSDIRDGQSGVNLHLIVRLINSLTCEPMIGVYVNVWQANAVGLYSGVENELLYRNKRSINGPNFIFGGPGGFSGGDGGPNGFSGGDGGPNGFGGGDSMPWNEGFDNRGGNGPYRSFLEQDRFDEKGGGNDRWNGGWQQDHGPPGERYGGYFDQFDSKKGPNDQRYPNNQSGPKDSKPIGPPNDQKGSSESEEKEEPVKPIDTKTDETAELTEDEIVTIETNETKVLTESDITIVLNTTDSPTSTPSDEKKSTIWIETTQSTQSNESNSDDSYNITFPEPTELPNPKEPIDILKPDQPDHHNGHRHSYFKQFHRRKPIDDNRFLRGYQKTNQHGDASFITIIPGWYRERSQHIHVEVYLDNSSPDKVTYVGQLYLPSDDQTLMNRLLSTEPYNQNSFNFTNHEDDFVLKESNDEQLILSLEPIGKGYQAIVTIGVDPTITVRPFLEQLTYN